MSESGCKARVDFFCGYKDYEQMEQCAHFENSGTYYCQHYCCSEWFGGVGYCKSKEARAEALNKLMETNKVTV